MIRNGLLASSPMPPGCGGEARKTLCTNSFPAQQTLVPQRFPATQTQRPWDPGEGPGGKSVRGEVSWSWLTPKNRILNVSFVARKPLRHNGFVAQQTVGAQGLADADLLLLAVPALAGFGRLFGHERGLGHGRLGVGCDGLVGHRFLLSPGHCPTGRIGIADHIGKPGFHHRRQHAGPRSSVAPPEDDRADGRDEQPDRAGGRSTGRSRAGRHERSGLSRVASAFELSHRRHPLRVASSVLPHVDDDRERGREDGQRLDEVGHAPSSSAGGDTMRTRSQRSPRSRATAQR